MSLTLIDILRSVQLLTKAGRRTLSKGKFVEISCVLGKDGLIVYMRLQSESCLHREEADADSASSTTVRMFCSGKYLLLTIRRNALNVKELLW